MFIQEAVGSPDFLLFIDAAVSLGYGGFVRGHWFSSAWPHDLFTRTSRYLQISKVMKWNFIPLLLQVIWGHQWTKLCIRIYCDNKTRVDIINKGCSMSSFIMKFIRRLTITAATHNFVFGAKHVPGTFNCISDALSRLQISRFRNLAPGAEQWPTACPPLSELMLQ